LVVFSGIILLEFYGISSSSREYVCIATPRENMLLIYVWECNENLLRPRRHASWVLKHDDILDQRVKQLIDHSGFGHLLKFKHIASTTY